jgi:dihydroflavonol-4-reductase
MNALVTGANSFIGAALIEELVRAGFNVEVILGKEVASPALSGLTFTPLEGDPAQDDFLTRSLTDKEFVFCLENMTQANQRAEFIHGNAAGIARLGKLAAALPIPPKRFVVLSHLAASGPATSLEPRDESVPAVPISWYGESKLQAEKEILQFKDRFPVTLIRTAPVYGPRDPALVSLIQQTLARNMMPILKGNTEDGHKYYSTIHVQDLARGLIQGARLTLEQAASGEMFYLAGDGVNTYRELMTTLAEELNLDPLKVQIPGWALNSLAKFLGAFGLLSSQTFSFNPDRLKELRADYWTCSNEKAKKVLGFNPEFDLNSGLAQTIEWYQKQRWL